MYVCMFVYVCVHMLVRMCTPTLVLATRDHYSGMWHPQDGGSSVGGSDRGGIGYGAVVRGGREWYPRMEPVM